MASTIINTLSLPGQRNLENPYAIKELEIKAPTTLKKTIINVFFKYRKNGIPALCSVSAELSNQFIALRQNMIYNPDADAKAALQTLQDQMQATMDAK